MSAPLPTASRWNTYSRSRYPRLWDGCVGAWCPSLGVTGTRLFDFTTRQNWGTLTNMDPPTDWVASRGGYALDFDGSNDRVDTTCKYAPGTGPLSVAFWWDGRDTAAYNNIVSNRPASFNGSTDHAWLIGNGDYTIGPANTKKIGVLLYTPSNYRVYLTSAEYNAGMRHYGFSSDGSSVTIYVDGVAVALGSTSGSAAVGNWPNMTQEHNTSIGGSPGGEADRYSNGIMDDVRIYSRALHPEEWRLLARRRAIAYEPEYQPAYYSETDAGGGGVTSRPYAWQSARIIGAGR